MSAAIPDLTRKVAVVTGATGMGRAGHGQRAATLKARLEQP